MKNSSVGNKRKAELVFEDESVVVSRLKRAKTVPTEDMMVIGLVPMMTIVAPPLKYAPNQDLVNRVKRIILSGIKTQKRVAKECGLSQTKMSQFMNLSQRVHGWDSVESKVSAWLKKSERRSQRSGHPLETDYSVPQSCIITHEQPKTEELGSTVYVQSRNSPWQFDDSPSTSSNSPFVRESDIEGSSPNEQSNQQMIYCNAGNEVTNTSSNLTAAEISETHLDQKKNSVDRRYQNLPELEPNWIDDPNTSGYFNNDCAWDNFSIVLALDSPL